MKRSGFLLSLCAAAACAGAADSWLKPVNDPGYGTWAARVQSLSMYRDYEGLGNGYASTLGWKLDYLSPEWQGLSGGASYLHVDVLQDAGGRYGTSGEALLSNGRVNELNELWMKYNLGLAGLEKTSIKAGRQVVNGEVFRADEFRQKPRSLEAAVLTVDELPDTSLTVGHADRLSNVWDSDSSGDRLNWRFKDVETVLGADESTRGVSWAEGVYTGVTNLEIAVYDACAYDIVNAAGGRVKFTVCDGTALTGCYRHETDTGSGAHRSSDMAGASLQQKLGGVTLEPGFLSVGGDSLVFSELYSGINHPLGSSMMIYSGSFDGGADNYFLKATTKIYRTTLYALYCYTTHDTNPYEGQELDAVIKYPFTDRFSVAFKGGVGYRDGKAGADTFASDSRLFVTYDF